MLSFFLITVLFLGCKMWWCRGEGGVDGTYLVLLRAQKCEQICVCSLQSKIANSSSASL
jgi:hypothetical protein